MDDVLEAYDIQEEFPTVWSDNKQDIADATMGTTFKSALINQLIGRLKSSTTSSTDDEADPMGRGRSVFATLQSRGIDIENLGEDRGVYLPSSTKFNAKSYLNVVHGDSDFAELEHSLQYLKHSINQDSSRRVVVGEDYEQFVTSKDQLDKVLAVVSGEASDGLLVNRLTDQLREASRSYTLIMRPLEECTIVRDKYQIALALAKNHRYVLALPATLQKHLNNLEHDEFVRDWKTGREYLLELKESSKSADCQKIGSLIEQKVKTIVETYRASVWKQLMNTQVDKLYVRSLEMLQDLEVQQNPLYEWMSHQVNQIHGNFEEFFERATQKLTTLYRCERQQEDDVELIDFIKRLDAPHSRLDTYDVIEHWIALQEVFGSLHELVVKAMVFWKDCTLIISGRKSVGNLKLDPKQETELRRTFMTIVEELSKSLLDLIQPPPEGSDMSGRTNYFPHNANSLSTSRFLNQIITILNETESEINQPVFSQTLVRIRTIFVAHTCTTWLRDAGSLGKTQTFSKIDHFESQTKVPGLFVTFHTLVLREVHKLGALPSNNLNSSLVAILSTSLKSYHSYLGESTKTPDESIEACGLQPLQIDQEMRLLITMNNLSTIKAESIPKVYQVFMRLFNSDGGEASYRLLCETADGLCHELFGHFTQKKRSQVGKIITDGFRSHGPQWLKAGTPDRISQHINEALMLLVDIHAEFSVYCPQFLPMVLSDLYHYILSAFLHALREFDQLGSFGALQLQADIEFVSEVMSTLRSSEDQKLLLQIKQGLATVSGATNDPRTVSTLIENALRTEELSFMCFQSVRLQS